MSNKNVVFDFDGVIHSYTSGWKGFNIIPDKPVDGIKEAIKSIRKSGYNVIVVSTRCTHPDGIDAIKNYLNKYDIEVDEVTDTKPPAIVYIDDRSICFDGHPETLLNKINNFKPWNYQPVFNEARIFGKKCLFSNEKIKREQFPNLNRYEVVLNTNLDKIVAILTDITTENFYGSLLSKDKLIHSHDDNFFVSNGNFGVVLKEGDICFYDNHITIDEYMEES